MSASPGLRRVYEAVWWYKIQHSYLCHHIVCIFISPFKDRHALSLLTLFFLVCCLVLWCSNYHVPKSPRCVMSFSLKCLTIRNPWSEILAALGKHPACSCSYPGRWTSSKGSTTELLLHMTQRSTSHSCCYISDESGCDKAPEVWVKSDNQQVGFWNPDRVLWKHFAARITCIKKLTLQHMVLLFEYLRGLTISLLWN